ncbi:hypothetical protein F2Q69_00044125 [Brassica cretica]|uniref:Uncharacterized protein n=1 Tax=Brassica cretica TaxID=69181 RepID=A0A8S9NLX7_BRACR|nr:hypothetical protein F2Q69_00044125 [Brassica cretica]
MNLPRNFKEAVLPNSEDPENEQDIKSKPLPRRINQKKFIARSRQTIKAFLIRRSRPDRSDSIHSSSRLQSASIRSCFRSRQHQLATRSARWTARVPFPISSRFISLVVRFNNHLRLKGNSKPKNP